MQIDIKIGSHSWRLRGANSNHIPGGTPDYLPAVFGTDSAAVLSRLGY